MSVAREIESCCAMALSLPRRANARLSFADPVAFISTVDAAGHTVWQRLASAAAGPYECTLDE